MSQYKILKLKLEELSRITGNIYSIENNPIKEYSNGDCLNWYSYSEIVNLGFGSSDNLIEYMPLKNLVKAVKSTINILYRENYKHNKNTIGYIALREIIQNSQLGPDYRYTTRFVSTYRNQKLFEELNKIFKLSDNYYIVIDKNENKIYSSWMGYPDNFELIATYDIVDKITTKNDIDDFINRAVIRPVSLVKAETIINEVLKNE